LLGDWGLGSVELVNGDGCGRHAIQRAPNLCSTAERRFCIGSRRSITGDHALDSEPLKDWKCRAMVDPPKRSFRRDRSVSLHQQGEQLIQVVLGILHDGIACVPGHGKRSAHDVVQRFGFSIRQQLPLPQNDRQAQDSVEGRYVERLLGVQQLLRRQLMFPIRHAQFSLTVP